MELEALGIPAWGGGRSQPPAHQPMHARFDVFYGQPARPAHTHHGDGGDGSRITRRRTRHTVLSSDGNGMDGPTDDAGSAVDGQVCSIGKSYLGFVLCAHKL